MKEIIYIVILLLVSFGLTSCFSQEIPKAISNLNEKIENDSIRKIVEENALSFPNNTQISIAIITKDTTEYIGAIRKNDVLEITDNKNNIFEIGSISKVFTSVLLSNLINKKEASLEETLANNFDFNLKEGEEITLQQLANHTAGFPKLPTNMGWMEIMSDQPYINYTPERLKDYLNEKVKLKSKPGDINKYSNFGAGILGYILTKKTGKSYNELLKNVICNPLQMNNTSTKIKDFNTNSIVNGLSAEGKEVAGWSFTDVLVGAGGIKSSVVDLEKFVRKNFENDVIYNLPQQETFIISDRMKVGLGWHIASKNNILWHNGGTAGYKSCLALNKEKKAAVVVLSNVSGLSKKGKNIDIICFKVLNQILK